MDTELYTVLDMNRQQLLTLTILLTLAAALSKLFTSPILTIKKTVGAHGMTYGVDCRDGPTCFWFRCPVGP